MIGYTHLGTNLWFDSYENPNLGGNLFDDHTYKVFLKYVGNTLPKIHGIKILRFNPIYLSPKILH